MNDSLIRQEQDAAKESLAVWIFMLYIKNKYTSSFMLPSTLEADIIITLKVKRSLGWPLVGGLLTEKFDRKAWGLIWKVNH